MTGREQMKALLEALAVTFENEGRAGAMQAASALRETVNTLPKDLPAYANPFEAEIRNGLTLSPTPLASQVENAMPYILWGGADLGEDRIPKDLADAMPTCELVGPDGMFFAENIRVGLWMQLPGLTYGPRHHIAEETFHIIAGEGLWSAEGRETAIHGSGAEIFHPSNIQHTSVTRDKPFFTAWRWSGEVGYDGYQLKG